MMNEIYGDKVYCRWLTQKLRKIFVVVHYMLLYLCMNNKM
jgi:hypothetical protein